MERHDLWISISVYAIVAGLKKGSGSNLDLSKSRKFPASPFFRKSIPVKYLWQRSRKTRILVVITSWNCLTYSRTVVNQSTKYTATQKRGQFPNVFLLSSRREGSTQRGGRHGSSKALPSPIKR